MAEARVYSERLGAISEAQFAAAAERLRLGRFVKAQPVTSGLFGQNVFVTTSEGEFVLRGAPHWVKGLGEEQWRREDRWQFTKEVFFARLLHEHTQVPMPWPMLHDEASDIFGWPYIVMPRMPGACFDERGILKALAPEDRRGVARALGAMLAQMQTLTAPFAGGFDVDTIALTPFEGSYTQHAIAELRDGTAMAQRNGAMTPEDLEWLAGAERRALAAGERPNTYVHCDYKLNNVTLSKDADGWRVSGLFDLHEAKFGDGGLDIVRQACSYLDTERQLARVFVESYFAGASADPRLKELMPLYVVNDRMKFWAFFTQPGARAAWTQGKTFRGWAQRYIDGILQLL